MWCWIFLAKSQLPIFRRRIGATLPGLLAHARSRLRMAGGPDFPRCSLPFLLQDIYRLSPFWCSAAKSLVSNAGWSRLPPRKGDGLRPFSCGGVCFFPPPWVQNGECRPVFGWCQPHFFTTPKTRGHPPWVTEVARNLFSAVHSRWYAAVFWARPHLLCSGDLRQSFSRWS